VRDEAQSLDVDLGVGAIAIVIPARTLDDPAFLVVPDGLGRQAGQGRHLADHECVIGLHDQTPSFAAGRQRRNSSALDTTLTEDSAMAAPEIIGFRSPKAASGMPITL